MTRLVGAALVMAGCGLGGASAVGRLTLRVRTLGQLRGAAELMSRELDLRLTPLPELLRLAAESIGDGPVKELFDTAAEGAQRPQAEAFGALWRRAVSGRGLGLSRADREELGALADVLGRYDARSQSIALMETAERLELLRRQAEEQYRRLGRVYAALSLAAGALLVILLI